MRVLAFLCSGLAGVVYYLWATTPLWSTVPSDSIHPVSMDRSRGQFLVLEKKPTGWYFDTIDTATGQRVKSVKLQLPADTQRLYCHYDPVHCTNLQLAAVGDLRDGAWITDVETGNPINAEPIATQILGGTAALHQDKVIVSQHGSVIYFDKADPRQRSIKIEGDAQVQFLPDHQHFLICEQTHLKLVEWQTGKVVAQASLPANRQRRVDRLVVYKSNEFLVGYYVDKPQLQLDRWRWNGQDQLRLEGTVALQSPGNVPQGQVGGSGFEVNRQGQLLISVFAADTWPAVLRPLLAWLENKQWNVSKLIPKETLLTQFTLSDDLRVLSREEVVSGLTIPLDASTGLRFKRVSSTGERMLVAIRTQPQWPNALAVALVCYLLIYVYFNRHRSLATK
jgi:hypothetical protein